MSGVNETPPKARPIEDFEDLYENAPCGHLSMLPDGAIIKANATLALWTGLTSEQLVRMQFHDLLTVGTLILYETSFAPLLAMRGYVDEASLDLRMEGGGKIAVFASGRVIKDEAGAPRLTRMSFFKAADRRHYERELVEAREQSRHSEHVTQELLKGERATAVLREQFIAVLGHDLRNPLASISGGVQLLSRDQPADRRNLLIETLRNSVTRMAGLIDNVLDFARGRLGAGIPVDIKPAMLAPVLEHVVAELRLGPADRAIEIDVHLPQPIQCDAPRIGQLVSNLLANALTHGAPKLPVRMHADTVDGTLTIWVANSGAPIPQAAMERLFQPFFRGEVRSSQQGLGLGLHISSEIAKAHGATLEVASSREETRFTLRMPRATQASL